MEASIIYKTRSFQVTDDDETELIQSRLDHVLNSQSSSGQSGQLPIVEGKADQNVASLSVTRIGVIENGKLSVEFTTVPAFHGQFIKQHASMPHVKSMVVGPRGQHSFGGSPENVEFGLELVWSQYTYDYPEQTWRATSTSVLNVSRVLYIETSMALLRLILIFFQELFW